MINCNPETVSTDYDTSDRLYFEPLTSRSSCSPVLERERRIGVVTQFGGQTPLKLAGAIEDAGFKLLGTPVEAIDLAEDRERFGSLLAELGAPLPGVGDRGAGRRGGRARRTDRLSRCSLRPSYVLGGRAMRVCYDAAQVRATMAGVDGAGAGRPLPRRRARDRRRRALRRRLRAHRRRDGARRGGGRPLGRLLLRAARRPRSTTRRYRDVCRVVRRLGPALGVVGLLNVQLALVDGGAPRARGEPARVADGAVRVQGDRRQPRRRGRSTRGRRRGCTSSTSLRGAAAGAGEREGGRSFRSRASRARIRCSGRRCARPAR